MSTIACTHAAACRAVSTSGESASTFDTEQQLLTAMDPRLLGVATIGKMLLGQEDEGATCSHASKSSEEDNDHHEDSSKPDLDDDLPDDDLSQEDSALLLATTWQLNALDDQLTQGSDLSAALGGMEEQLELLHPGLAKLVPIIQALVSAELTKFAWTLPVAISKDTRADLYDSKDRSTGAHCALVEEYTAEVPEVTKRLWGGTHPFLAMPSDKRHAVVASAHKYQGTSIPELLQELSVLVTIMASHVVELGGTLAMVT
ncbi:hypothetical protein BC828DRAFT_432477 [Blastocladiella britannica]|nr:hypothetical protein BC828DRAFT_432477 [Blastocladiella britannica]